MRHLKKHIERVSLEDAENSEADLTPKDPVVELVASEPEEVEELKADLLVDPEPAGDSVRAEIEEIEDMSVAVEEFQALLKGAVTRGGMRAEEGAIVGTTLKHFRKRLGITDKETLSQEDFGGTMSRLKATQISQEGFAETVGTASAKIRELIAKLIAFLKEKVAAFDVQGQKVKAIITQIKQRVKTIVTGEIELEFEGKRIGEDDVFHPKTLLNAAVWASGLNSHMSAHLRATSDVIKRSVREEGSAESFNEQISGMWGKNANPISAVMRAAGSVGVRLTQTYHAVLVHKEMASRNPVLSHSLELKGNPPAPIKMTLNKGQFIALMDTTEKMNDAVQAMIKDYAANAGVVGGVNGPLGDTDAALGQAITRTVSGMVTMVENDLYPIMQHISGARGELGYVIAIAAKKFGL